MTEKIVEEKPSEKDAFRIKVMKATDAKLKSGYGALKRQERLANEKLTKERTDVEKMLQNPTYLKALQQVEEAKRDLSIASWKKGEVVQEMLKRFKNTEENDTEFEKA